MRTLSESKLVERNNIDPLVWIGQSESSSRKEWLIRNFKLQFPNILIKEITHLSELEAAPAILYKTKLNDVRRINKFLIDLNVSLPINGQAFLSFEDLEQRKKRQVSNFKSFYAVFSVFDYLIHRVLPKLPLTRIIYFAITRGHNRAVSHAEMLGRLYACGFELLQEEKHDTNTSLIVRKIKEPLSNNKPTYGPLIHLKRVGKNGRILNIYKVRTMHPFSEYLQEYIYTQNKLQEGGKIKNDFRITRVGKIMRKYWIDELPSIYNLLRGDLKIVGVRPLSLHYFNLYSTELQTERKQVKPGLIPPFYADLPKTIDEIMQSELNYLRKYKEAPLTTDIKYFGMAVYNIIVKKARSA